MMEETVPLVNNHILETTDLFIGLLRLRQDLTV